MASSVNSNGSHLIINTMGVSGLSALNRNLYPSQSLFPWVRPCDKLLKTPSRAPLFVQELRVVKFVSRCVSEHVKI